MCLLSSLLYFELGYKKLQDRMADTPNFNDFKEECNSNRLENCFHFLFMQEMVENESFVELLVEECKVVARRMQKRLELLQEGQAFSPFGPVSSNGMQCMREAQRKDGRIFAALNSVLVLARDAGEEKLSHVAIMEQFL